MNMNKNLSTGLWVKICGITDLSTALAAVEAGADALGFVFASSRRQATIAQAREIIKNLPPRVEKIGVFVNTSPLTIAEIAAFCGLTGVQLCGNEPPDFSLAGPYKVIRTVPVRSNGSIPNLNRYRAHAFLFDTFKAGAYGGTGEVFDWNLLSGIDSPKPVIVAGGLNPENVQEAVSRIRPFGVDVSSGVETNGRKDVMKIRQFVKLAKAYY